MGQKRERTIDLASFGDGDKECLVRLVKELAKEGATGDKVRPSPPSASSAREWTKRIPPPSR